MKKQYIKPQLLEDEVSILTARGGWVLSDQNYVCGTCSGGFSVLCSDCKADDSRTGCT